MSAQLRRADVRDASAVAACVRRAYAKYDKRLPRPPKPVLADYTSVLNEHEGWLLEDNGQCIGVLVLEPKADHLYLDNIAVDPDHQGQGLGRILLDFAETQAREQGLPEVRLYTNALMSENLSLYARRGYKETARREIDGRAVVFMSKKLGPPTSGGEIGGSRRV